MSQLVEIQEPVDGRYSIDESGLRWKSDTQSLTYRIGPLHLGIVNLRCCTLATSFLNLPSRIDPPISKLADGRCQAIVYPAWPVSRNSWRVQFARRYIRYVPRHEDRHFIKLEGSSFESYMSGFSAKTRNTFRRHVRRFAEAAGGSVDCRVYRTADEMRVFRDLALAISKRTYQHAKGVGLPESEEFAREMVSEASAGRARGYLLFLHDRPAAFAYCTIDQGALLYAKVGFDPDLSDRSPGRVLLLTLIEAMFLEGTMRYLDFGMEEYDYKSFFSTDRMRCSRVFFLPWSVRNALIVLSHLVILDIWQLGSFALNFVRRLRAQMTRFSKKA